MPYSFVVGVFERKSEGKGGGTHALTHSLSHSHTLTLCMCPISTVFVSAKQYVQQETRTKIKCVPIPRPTSAYRQWACNTFHSLHVALMHRVPGARGGGCRIIL
uniref:Uncharacterized protein n=1 Tax=Trypanosoma vivax (strain Y486) TaxID=1055687 RepID=G0U0K8_TRYVY|nr:hypothetical protein TVY486_0802160 [Trypanosoma vivax Y486]